MGKLISRALTGAIVFVYGVFTLVLYNVIALSKGTYFKRPTEKEKLELELGENLRNHIALEHLLIIQLVTVSGTCRRTMKVYLTTS